MRLLLKWFISWPLGGLLSWRYWRLVQLWLLWTLSWPQLGSLLLVIGGTQVVSWSLQRLLPWFFVGHG